MKNKNYDKTHRCTKLLNHNESSYPTCAIRHITVVEYTFDKDILGWNLFYVYSDSEYDVIYLRRLTKIEYCPFCGEKLEI